MTASSHSPLPPGRLRVLVVRHGETNENVAGIIQGQLDTDLNSFGRLQAATTARHLSTVRLDRIITSPLRRARDTAQAILDQQPASSQLQLEQDDRLKERAFGVLEGKRYSGPANRSEEDTSSFEQKHHLLERLASFWNELVTFPISPGLQETSSFEQTPAKHQGDDERVILLVSHGATISALLDELLLAGQYLHVPLDFRPSRRENCCITEIVVPTILDRRILSASSKPAGDINLQEDWTIRPQHLGVQGCQKLLGIQNLEVQLAHSRDLLATRSNASVDSDLETHVQQLQTRLELSCEGLEKDGVRRRLEEDVLRGPDGQEVMQDLGCGKGVGYIVKWADTTHLRRLMNGMEEEGLKHSQGGQVNVDELVERSDPTA
jgi:broad specificity phosphatase PhoE